MNEEQEEKLQAAEERLSTAKLLVENGRYVDAVSRAYYSMFHAAKALLLEEGSDPKTHSGVSSELGNLFRDELGREMTREFSRIREKREKADYGELSDIDGAEVEDIVDNAEEFLLKVRRVLE